MEDPALGNDHLMQQKLLDIMNEGVIIAGKNQRILYANKKLCELTEYSLSELLGKLSFLFWDEKTITHIRYVNEHLRRKGISSQYEGTIKTKHGQRVPALVSGSPLPDGSTIAIVTDLRPMREREKNEKILSTATKFSKDAVIVFNREGNIESWNKGAKLIFGYKEHEIIGGNIERIVLVKDHRELFVSGKVKVNFDLEARHKNKTLIKISTTITPIKSEIESGETFYLLMARDITNQSKYEEEVALKYQKIKEAYNQFGIIRRQMDYVFELIELAREYPDRKSVADFIVSSVIMLTRVDACVLRTFNEEKNTLDLISVFGVAEDWQGKMSIKFEKSLAQKAFEQHAPVRIIDVTKESRYQSRFLARKQNLCSLLLIPLEYHGKFIGSLSLYSMPEKKLDIFENEFIEQYAHLVEVILGSVTCGDRTKITNDQRRQRGMGKRREIEAGALPQTASQYV